MISNVGKDIKWESISSFTMKGKARKIKGFRQQTCCWLYCPGSLPVGQTWPGESTGWRLRSWRLCPPQGAAEQGESGCQEDSARGCQDQDGRRTGPTFHIEGGGMEDKAGQNCGLAITMTNTEKTGDNREIFQFV